MEKGRAFESAVHDALSRCRHDGSLLAAVSGGADSTAMLIAAAAARKSLSFQLYCVHVDHGIRPEEECAADGEFVRSICSSLDIPCRVVSIGRGVVMERARAERCGIEAAARTYRHAAWTEEARRVGARRVLVGHTQDDLLETAIIRFLRGAGPVGLSAMAEERGLVFRPLLSLSRSEVLAYLADKGVAFRTDSTNADPSYFRNRVRLRLVPLLDSDFPLWRRSVASLVRTQAEAAAFITDESSKRIVWRETETGDAAVTTESDNFFAQSAIIRQEAIYAAVDRISAGVAPRAGTGFSADEGRRKASEPRREAVRKFVSGAVASIDLGTARAANRGGSVVVEPVLLAAERGFSMVVREPGAYRVDRFSLSVSAVRREGAFPVLLPALIRPVSAEDRIELGGRMVPASRKVAGEMMTGTRAVVVEDVEGIAAVLYTGPEGQRVLQRAGRNGAADYSQRVFFSILLQRG